MIANISKATADQQTFYKALFDGIEDRAEIRLIKEGEEAKRLFLTLDELMNYSTPNDTNVYIGMYGRRGKGRGRIQDCTKTNVIYLDFDNVELMEIQFRINQAQLPTPSMVVSSGNGWHIYWQLDKPEGHKLKPIITKLAKVLKADEKATDTARILRVPDTNNVKGDPLPCSLVEYTGRKTPLKTFEQLLGVKAHIEQPQQTGASVELLGITLNGLNNMASGVKKGERNFCTGRIIQTLKRLNYTKYEMTEIVMKWNLLNKPAKEAREIKNEINEFWHADSNKRNLRYDGRTFSKSHLQKLNERFLDYDSTFFIGDYSDYDVYDNDLLGDRFHETSGLTFAIHSIIKNEKTKGITLKEIAYLCRRNTRDKNLLESIEFLIKQNHLNKKISKGKATVFLYKEKPFSDKRGFTTVPSLLHKLYLESCKTRELEKELKVLGKKSSHDGLNETRYKLIILLESYAYDTKREAYPTNRTLADRMRLTTRTIKNNLEWLERNKYIEPIEKNAKRYIRLIY